MKKALTWSLFSIAVYLLLLNSLPVQAILSPDLNGDREVDFRDMAIVAKSFDSQPEDDKWNPNADINRDEKVDIEDLLLIAKHFGPIEDSISGFIEPETFTTILFPGETVTETIEITYSSNFDYELGTLNLKTSEGYDTWLTTLVPSEFTEAWTNTEPYTFEVTLTVPNDTPSGNYIFQIIANTAGGQPTEEIHQEIDVLVPPANVVPEVPLGTIIATASMITALIVYITRSKWTRRLRIPSPN